VHNSSQQTEEVHFGNIWLDFIIKAGSDKLNYYAESAKELYFVANFNLNCNQ